MTGLRIRSLICSAVVSLACFMAGGPANAGADEQPKAQRVDQQKMRAYLFSDGHKNLVSRVMATIPPTVFKRCPSLVSNGSNVNSLTPITFGEDGVPNSGAWKETFPVQGCGNDTVLNLYFSVANDGAKINGIAGFPGSTHADLILQKDALHHAEIGANSLAGNCAHFDVKNTRFEGHGLSEPATPDPGASARFRPWWETWTMVGCERTFDVMLDFMPDATGTTIAWPRQVQER
jgi:hypothetical protein